MLGEIWLHICFTQKYCNIYLFINGGNLHNHLVGYEPKNLSSTLHLQGEGCHLSYSSLAQSNIVNYE